MRGCPTKKFSLHIGENHLKKLFNDDKHKIYEADRVATHVSFVCGILPIMLEQKKIIPKAIKMFIFFVLYFILSLELIIVNLFKLFMRKDLLQLITRNKNS